MSSHTAFGSSVISQSYGPVNYIAVGSCYRQFWLAFLGPAPNEVFVLLRHRFTENDSGPPNGMEWHFASAVTAWQHKPNFLFATPFAGLTEQEVALQNVRACNRNLHILQIEIAYVLSMFKERPYVLKLQAVSTLSVCVQRPEVPHVISLGH